LPPPPPPPPPPLLLLLKMKEKEKIKWIRLTLLRLLRRRLGMSRREGWCSTGENPRSWCPPTGALH
jgi:hypothetical protein